MKVFDNTFDLQLEIMKCFDAVLDNVVKYMGKAVEMSESSEFDCCADVSCTVVTTACTLLAMLHSCTISSKSLDKFSAV